MEVPNSQYGKEGTLLFADCAVNPNPNAEELASIAISTADNAKTLCGMDPKVQCFHSQVWEVLSMKMLTK